VSFGLLARRDGAPLQRSSRWFGMGTLGGRSRAFHILDSHTTPIPPGRCLGLGSISV